MADLRTEIKALETRLVATMSQEHRSLFSAMAGFFLTMAGCFVGAAAIFG